MFAIMPIYVKRFIRVSLFCVSCSAVSNKRGGITKNRFAAALFLRLLCTILAGDTLRRALAVIPLAFAFMLLFGCAAQPSAPASTEPVSAQQAAENRPSSVQNEPAAVPSASESLLGALQKSDSYKVVYIATARMMEGDESGSIARTVQMTQYNKGGDFRTDIEFPGMQTVRTYTVSGKISYCVLSKTIWACTDVTGQQEDTLHDFRQVFQKDPSKYAITANGSMAVAGTKAACYNIEGTGMTARYCISPDGAPLYFETHEPDAEMVRQAENYAISVADTDFALPDIQQKSPG
jgi:hypothetical protein